MLHSSEICGQFHPMSKMKCLKVNCLTANCLRIQTVYKFSNVLKYIHICAYEKKLIINLDLLVNKSKFLVIIVMNSLKNIFISSFILLAAFAFLAKGSCISCILNGCYALHCALVCPSHCSTMPMFRKLPIGNGFKELSSMEQGVYAQPDQTVINRKRALNVFQFSGSTVF